MSNALDEITFIIICILLSYIVTSNWSFDENTFEIFIGYLISF